MAEKNQVSLKRYGPVITFFAGWIFLLAASVSFAATDIGVAPERTLMVGDHPEADGAAARAAGMQTYILPAWSGAGPRGLGHVVELVDRSRDK